MKSKHCTYCGKIQKVTKVYPDWGKKYHENGKPIFIPTYSCENKDCETNKPADIDDIGNMFLVFATIIFSIWFLLSLFILFTDDTIFINWPIALLFFVPLILGLLCKGIHKLRTKQHKE